MTLGTPVKGPIVGSSRLRAVRPTSKRLLSWSESEPLCTRPYSCIAVPGLSKLECSWKSILDLLTTGPIDAHSQRDNIPRTKIQLIAKGDSVA